MPETESRLGEAITALGLEDAFLSNGELQKFPLVERGKIANEIISEKLKRGRWEGVINMIFGGLGKADALYEGDKDKLRQDILESARSHPTNRITFAERETVKTLVKSKEYDLLFGLLMTDPPKLYEEFTGIAELIPQDFFSDQTKKDKFNNMAAEKATNERLYYAAINHYKETNNSQGLDQIFEEALASQARDSFASYSSELEEIALTDETKKEARIKRLVTSFKESPSQAQFSLKMYLKYSPKMTEEEREEFYNKVSKNISGWEIRRIEEDKKLGLDPKLKLAWAKHHAKLEPKIAYTIFCEQRYNGSELVEAVNAGLELEHYKNEETKLYTLDVKEEHLRLAYPSASQKVKRVIVSALGDKTKLQSISKQAKKKGELHEAYSLWRDGFGYEGEYMNQLRTQMIEDGIKSDHSYFGIDQQDKLGQTQAFDAFMKAGKKDRKMYLEAYNIALESDLDEERLQRARETLVSINPSAALSAFRGYQEGIKDPVGVNYVLGIIAERTNTNQEQLKRLVEKYYNK